MKVEDQLTELIHEASKEGRNVNTGTFILSPNDVKKLRNETYVPVTDREMQSLAFNGVSILQSDEVESPRLIFDRRY